MSDLLRDAINAFAAVLRAQMIEDQFLRDIVHDNRGLPPTSALGSGGAHTVVGVSAAPIVTTAGEVRTNNAGAHGWVNTPQVDAWKPPSEDVFNHMMDNQDRKDRQDRINEELKRARGGG